MKFKLQFRPQSCCWFLNSWLSEVSPIFHINYYSDWNETQQISHKEGWRFNLRFNLPRRWCVEINPSFLPVHKSYIFPVLQEIPLISHPQQWDSPWESAAESVCSRLNSWTGWMGALRYCKPSMCLVVSWGGGGDTSAAFFFVGSLPSFSVVFLVLHLCQMAKVKSPLATHGSPQRTKG